MSSSLHLSSNTLAISFKKFSNVISPVLSGSETSIICPKRLDKPQRDTDELAGARACSSLLSGTCWPSARRTGPSCPDLIVPAALSYQTLGAFGGWRGLWRPVSFSS